MVMTNNNKVPVLSDIAGLVTKFNDRRYFSQLKQVLGLKDGNVLVEMRDKTELGSIVYAAGGIAECGETRVIRYGIAYREPKKKEFDKYTGVVPKQEAVDTKLTHEDITDRIKSKILELRKKHDIPKKV